MQEIDNIRYNFEHIILPSIFYDNTKELIEKIKCDEYFLDKIFFSICVEQNVFDIWVHKYICKAIQNDNINIYHLTCPNPITTPQCSDIFFVFNDKKSLVFTNEYDDFLGLTEPGNILCGWKKDKTHINFGNVKKNEDLVEKVIKIFDTIVE